MGTPRAEGWVEAIGGQHREAGSVQQRRGSLGPYYPRGYAGRPGSWSWGNKGPEATLVDPGSHGLCSPTRCAV